MKFYVFQRDAFAKFYSVITVVIRYYIIAITLVKYECFISGIYILEGVVTGATY